MCNIISFFNHKGGVGKTTLVHNLSFALSDKNQRVLCIDADPQMNLTASMYGLSTSVEYSTEEDSKWNANCKQYISLSEYLDIYLRSEPCIKKKFHTNSKHGKGSVELISGSINLANNEGDLYQVIKNANTYTKDIASKFQKALLDLKNDYDFILIDTSPSASSIINAMMIMSSNYLITPVAPSFFSLQAIDNLSNIIKNWSELLQPYQTTSGFQGINLDVKFLGLIVQLSKRFKGGGSNYTSTAESWIKEVNKSVTKFQKFAISRGMSITDSEFSSAFTGSSPFVIEKCCDFTPQLRGIAEEAGIPVLYLDQPTCKDYNKKYSKQVDITTENGQYKMSMDSVKESYNTISEGLLRLDSLE